MIKDRLTLQSPCHVEFRHQGPDQWLVWQGLSGHGFCYHHGIGPLSGPGLRSNFGYAMDATLMFSASAPPSNTPSGVAANPPAGGTQPSSGSDTTQTNTPQGRIFAGLMRDLLPTHERQDVAALVAPSVESGVPSPGRNQSPYCHPQTGSQPSARLAASGLGCC